MFRSYTTIQDFRNVTYNEAEFPPFEKIATLPYSFINRRKYELWLCDLELHDLHNESDLSQSVITKNCRKVTYIHTYAGLYIRCHVTLYYNFRRWLLEPSHRLGSYSLHLGLHLSVKSRDVMLPWITTHPMCDRLNQPARYRSISSIGALHLRRQLDRLTKGTCRKSSY
jgi:hypothetical protein